MGIRDKIADLISAVAGAGSTTLEVSSGTLAIAFITIIAACICVCALILLVSLRLRRPLQDPQMQLVAGLRGKIEKIEKTINELNTDRARAREFYQLEFDFLKNELDGLKARTIAADLDTVRDVKTGHIQVAPEEPKKTAPVQPSSPERRESNAPIFEMGSGAESANLGDLKKKSSERPLDREASTNQPDLNKGISEPVASLNVRLTKTRQGFFSRLKEVFSTSTKLDPYTIDELEAILIGADLGTKATEQLIDELKLAVKGQKDLDQTALLQFLQTRVAHILANNEHETFEITAERQPDGPKVVMLVGVNGTGKTTSVAKLTRHWKEQGKKVLMVAADTFRAAAVDQLQVWADRLGVEIVSGGQDVKPQTVVFEAMERAKAGQYDVIIIDTAGRLHNKANLMQELEGVKNVIRRHQPSAPHEVILVVDGTSGQNALVQAHEFNAATELTGIIVTKLDGSAKGGIVVAIKNELGLPVRYIGVGESYNDLRPFRAAEFAEALFAA